MIQHGLSWVWQLRGDDRQALEHATRALALFRELDKPVWEARELNQVGWFSTRIGDHEAARTQIGRASCRERV